MGYFCNQSFISYKKVPFFSKPQYYLQVRFCKAIKVHCMIHWAFAYKAARRGPWEEYARNRERFRNRISQIEKSLEWVPASNHRNKVNTNRFSQV